MHHTRLQVPSLLVAHKAFMNTVCRFDKQRLFHPIMRLENRISTSLLNFALDSILHNTFAVLHKIEPTDFCFAEFKRRVAIQLVTPELQRRQNISQRSLSQCSSVKHYLVERVLKKGVQCIQFKLLFTDGKRKKFHIQMYKVQDGALELL